MELKVDRESDALYLRLDESAIVESEEVQPGIVLDYDKDGDLIGLEIREASTKVENPYAIAYVVGEANFDKPRPKD